MFIGCLLLASCNESNESINEKQVEQNVQAKKAQASLTQNEQALFTKLQRMAGEEFRHELNTYSKEEIEKFAINFLKEEVFAVLSENGVSREIAEKQLKENPSETIHTAVVITTSKLNLN